MAVLFALTAAVVYGVADYFGGRASRVHPAAVVTAIGQAVSLVLLVTGLLVMQTPAPAAPTFAWALAGGAAGAFALVSLYHSFSHGSMTVAAPLSAVMSAIVPVIGGLIAGERPRSVAYVGIVLAIGAVALISGAIGERHQPTPARIAVLAAAAGVGFGLFFIAIDRCADDAGLWPLALARMTSVPVLLGVCLVSGARPGSPRRLLWLAVVAGTLDMLANVGYLLAVRHGMLSLVAVVVALYPASTIMLAFVIDRERVNRWQVFGMVLAGVSIALVTVGRG